MSTDVQQHPPASVASEEFRAHEEAPGFDQTLARARARARGLTLTGGARRAPERHTADDFAALVARVCRVPVEAVKGAAALRGALEPPPPSRRPNTAGEWRIAHYIPGRHRNAVLQLCPAPVEPTEALPAGQCKCKGGKRHFVPQNESQRAALESVCNFVRAAERGEGPALILVGPTGTGKSHLLWAACRALNERGVNAAGTSWKRLSDTIRDAKSHPDPELRMRAAYERDRYTNASSLHLDEVRATAGTDFDPTELSLIAVERHDNCQALLMTSQQRGAALTALTDSAATGRLAIVEMIGSNYRKPHEAPAGQLRAAVSA